MLESVKIARRQSEIRQTLAGLVGNEQPTEEQTRQMESLDSEYRANETRYRAALISEDQERKEAKGALEMRGDKEWSDLIGQFEMRQVALALDEGRQLDGATAEVVTELRQNGGYRGMPVPWLALERRAGETVASATPDPVVTRPIIDRLFPDSAAARMGAEMITIDHGEVEYPVATQGAQVGWATSETGSVGAAQAYETVDRPLKPDYTLGAQMKITRKSLKQSGTALEAAVRRDMNGAIAQEMDRVVFLGSGTDGEPTGVIYGADDFGITTTAINATVSWGAFRSALVRFMTANAATFVVAPNSGQGSVRAMIRPEVYDTMDQQYVGYTSTTEFERLAIHLGAQNVIMSSNALPLVDDSLVQTTAVLTSVKNGVPPIFVGTWGAVDLIRDPFSDAASGGLRLTALATMDVTISRAHQIEILSGLDL